MHRNQMEKFTRPEMLATHSRAWPVQFPVSPGVQSQSRDETRVSITICDGRYAFFMYVKKFLEVDGTNLMLKR